MLTGIGTVITPPDVIILLLKVVNREETNVPKVEVDVSGFVGNVEALAVKNELRENDDLNRDFMIKQFITEQKTDIIVECLDGYQFRIIARGAEQKIRGKKWQGKRPGLIIGDDLEDDEQVESKDRRKKFSRWFFRACKQALRDGGKIRVHGTILHEDSLLHHLIKNPGWASKLYRAHTGFDDFTNILWPEKFPEARLREVRQEFIDEGDSAGYSQEYLNNPLDNDDAYLKQQDFIAMSIEDHEKAKVFRIGVDLAVSKNDKANRSSFTVGGFSADRLLHVVGQRVGRWDSMQIIEEFFSLQEEWSPDIFFVEDGVIWKAIFPMIQTEMLRRGVFLSFRPILSVKDKKVRGRPLQKRMRAQACRFDKENEWYAPFEEENLRFTGDAEATLDDQFDSFAILARGAEEYVDIEVEDFETEEEADFNMQSHMLRKVSGRSAVTGY